MSNNMFLLALAVSVVVFFANQWLSAMPEVIPASESEKAFSAQRAMVLLSDLLEEDVPHPVGSEANKRIKNKILKWLSNKGIDTEVQASWGCSRKWYTCAWVENIIAVIPGEQDSPYVALMAHYDSVPTATGAGDDGAGVATVMEVARMLKNEGPFRNPVMLIITDAEERGLLGAEAFFAYHPLRDKIGVVINVEGSGTSGPSRLLRTSADNRTLINLYRKTVRYPVGASVANEIFKRMPNDTDFSVSLRAKVAGIDFAFAGERNHYHTKNDNLTNLDPRTLQHHGENVLPLARALVAADLDSLDESSQVYANAFGLLFTWPSSINFVWIIVALLLLLSAAYRIKPRPVRLLLALFSPLLFIVTISLATFANFRLIEWINGTTVSWPANDLPFRMVLFATPAVFGFSLALFVNRYFNHEESLLGLWFFWLLLALAGAIYLPDGANMLILPLVPASVVIAISVWLRAPARELLPLATLVMLIPVSLSFVLSMEVTQGYRLIVSTFFGLGIYFASVSPFVRGKLVKPAIISTAVVAVAGSIGAVSLPLYSAVRPQLANIQFVQNFDTGSAYLLTQAVNPLPDKFVEVQKDAADVAVYPWSLEPQIDVTPAKPVNIAAPGLTVRKAVATDNGYEVDLVLDSQRDSHEFVLVFPAAAELISFDLQGDKFDVEPFDFGLFAGNYRLSFHGVQNKLVELHLTFSQVGPHTGHLIEISSILPVTSSDFTAARQPLATPVHRGDQYAVFREISL